MKSSQRQLIKRYLDPLEYNYKLVVGCLLIAMTVGLIVHLCMPEVYKCKVLLQYEYQQIDSGRNIQEQQNQQLQDTVSALRNSIVVRNNLENIIEQFELYSELRGRLSVAEVVDLLRKQIQITSSDHAVTISFKGRSRDKVMNVTNILASKFIEENFKYNERQRNNTPFARHDFLAPQLSAEEHSEHKQQGYTFKIVDSAHFPVKPYSPDVLVIMMVAVGAGLGVGVSLAYVLNLFDTSLKDSAEVERFLKLPVVSSVAYLEEPEYVSKASAFSCPVGERFRILRTRIQHPMAGSSPRTVLVTSATSGEGKSFVCANLAISFSQGIDSSAILVDADLRQPSLARFFGHANDQGLVNYLRHERDIGSLLVNAGVGKLRIMPGGRTPVLPAELLRAESIAELVAELTGRYGNKNSIVIFDAPPLDCAAETALLAQQVDAVILVVRWGVSKREHVKALLDRIDTEKVAGVVVNAYKPTLLERKIFGSCKVNKKSLC